MVGSVIKRPTAGDIKAAIAAAESGDWIEPSRQPGTWWRCELYDSEGRQIGDGDALTKGMAMGLAWLHHWVSDALIEARVKPGSVPFEVPDGFRFELTVAQADGYAITEEDWWSGLADLIAECTEQDCELGKALLDGPAGHWAAARAAGVTPQAAVEELADRIEPELAQKRESSATVAPDSSPAADARASLARLAREGRADMAALVESGDMSVRRALRHLQGASRA